jgi:hypothetical protein
MISLEDIDSDSATMPFKSLQDKPSFIELYAGENYRAIEKVKLLPFMVKQPWHPEN